MKLNRRQLRRMINNVLNEEDAKVSDREMKAAEGVAEFLKNFYDKEDISQKEKEVSSAIENIFGDDLDPKSSAGIAKQLIDLIGSAPGGAKLPAGKVKALGADIALGNVPPGRLDKLANLDMTMPDKSYKPGSGGLSAASSKLGDALSGGGEVESLGSIFDMIGKEKGSGDVFSREKDKWGYYRKTDESDSGWQYVEQKKYKGKSTDWKDIPNNSKGHKRLKQAEKDNSLTKLDQDGDRLAKLDESYSLSRGALYRKRYRRY